MPDIQQLYLPSIIIFWIEIIINFNTDYYDEGCPIQERKKIIKNYFKTNFILDLATTAALFLDYFTNKHIFIIIFMLKVKSIKKLFG